MTWRGRHIYLIGLPGAGKTIIGSELARLLSKSNYEFVDLDSEIIKKTGKSIAALFAEPNGAARFRDLETNVLLEVAKRAFDHKPCVVATGGGTPLRAINRSLMRGSGVSVWLDVTVKQAAKNVLASLLQGETRPLLRSSSVDELNDKLRSLHAERLPFYEQSTLHFVTRSARGDERTAKELADEVLTALEQMSRKILLRPRFEIFPVHASMGDYPVAVGSGIAAQELAFAIRDMNPRRVVIVTDQNVEKLYGRKFYDKVLKERKAEIDLHQIILEPGEIHKSSDTLFELLDSFVAMDLRRKSDLIVTIGGGVVSDTAACAASLYNRGMPLIHIPTTLIAQVDASLGGKTGVDYKQRKNAIGTFYPPRQVICDPLFLKTLPNRELQAGLSEILKYGLIGSRSFWNTHSKGIRRLLRGFDTGYEIIIREAIQEKIRYIEEDEYERQTGVRELLNFGHTFAHAFESASNFEGLLHGEAVALGMRAASWLSMEIGYLAEDEWREIEHVIGRLPVPETFTVEKEKILSFMTSDKKQRGAGLRLVLLDKIGRARVHENVPVSKVSEAIEFIQSVV